MANGERVNVFLNPFMWGEGEKDNIEYTGQQPSADSALRFLCSPMHQPTIEELIIEIVDRYMQSSEKAKQSFAIPHVERILDRIAWPLKHAMSCFMIGDEIGAIALCGMAAEMLAILRFEIVSSLKEKGLRYQSTSNLPSKKKFESKNQSARVKYLAENGFITNPLKNSFDNVRKIRNKYLHYFFIDYADISNDAISIRSCP